MFRIIILDFDGVILESVDVKTRAFRSLFSFSSQHVDEIVRFHIENGGMSRFDKFRHIFKNILHEDLSEEKFEYLSQRFSSLVEDAVLIAPFVKGALRFLEATAPRYPLYIVSATPADELKRIVRGRGILRFFAGVHGSPKTKADQIRGIVSQNQLSCRDVLFVGDAINDLRAARECGIGFVGRIRPGDPDIFAGHEGVVHTISDLDDLALYLEHRQ